MKAHHTPEAAHVPSGRSLHGGWVALPFIAYLFLSVCFVFMNPAGNAPAETAHMAYLRDWVETGQLPSEGAASVQASVVASSPPLYYALLRYSVYPFVQKASATTQYRALRLVSVLFHGMTLFFVWLVARRAFAGRASWAVGATAFVALNPAFAFAGASISNEVLANLLMAMLIYFALKTLQEPANLWSLLFLGLTAGVGATSRMAVVLPTVLALLYLLEQRHIKISEFLFVGALMALVAAPVFVRNFLNYGDPLGLATTMIASPGDAGFAGLYRWMQTAIEGFWARFGLVQQSVPRGFYVLIESLCLLSLVGILAAVRQGKHFEKRAYHFLGILSSGILLQAAVFGVGALLVQTRDLYLGLAAFAPFLFWGFKYWIDKAPTRARAYAWAGIILVAVSLQWASLSLVANTPRVIPGVHSK